MSDDQLPDRAETAEQGVSRRIYILVLVLLVLGASILFARFTYLGESGLTGGDTLWRLTMQIKLEAPKEPVTFRISHPLDTRHAKVVAQKLYHPGMRIRRSGTKANTRGEILARTIRPGHTVLQSEFIIWAAKSPFLKTPIKPVQLQADESEPLLQPEAEATNQQVQALLDQLIQEGVEQYGLLSRIHRYVHEAFTDDARFLNDDLSSVIKTKRATALGRARLMAALCRAAGYPTRLVSGFILKESTSARPHYWVEAFDNGYWLPYDPANGHALQLPANYLTVTRGDGDIIKFPPEVKPSISYQVAIDTNHRDLLPTGNRGILDIVNFIRLPITTRYVLALLLLLPLGALVNTFFRHIIGVRTFGAVTPALLALSVIHADLVTALILVIIVGAIGLTGRSVVPGKPDRLPRFTLMITLVALSMVLGMSILDYFQLQPEGQSVLLPVVVMTMLVDRFYTVMDESGKRIASIRLLWTFLVGLVCYFILQMESLGHLLLQYPELHFITFALALLLSIYKGKKLSGTTFFRWLREPKKGHPGTGHNGLSSETNTTS